jgi:hypothetical protein
VSLVKKSRYTSSIEKQRALSLSRNPLRGETKHTAVPSASLLVYCTYSHGFRVVAKLGSNDFFYETRLLAASSSVPGPTSSALITTDAEGGSTSSSSGVVLGVLLVAGGGGTAAAGTPTNRAVGGVVSMTNRPSRLTEK